MKAALSATAFCGAVHIHGGPTNRSWLILTATLTQTGNNKALHELRKAWAPHLCGDRHSPCGSTLGVDSHRDGPFGFTSPAIVNTIYGRWWKPEDETRSPPDPELPASLDRRF